MFVEQDLEVGNSLSGSTASVWACITYRDILVPQAQLLEWSRWDKPLRVRQFESRGILLRGMRPALLEHLYRLYAWHCWWSAGTKLFVLVTWKLCLCRRQILLRHLVGSSTLAFVVSCIFNLGPCAVLCLRSHKTACKHRSGFSWENPRVWRSLHLYEASIWVGVRSLLCSQCRVACCGPRDVLSAAVCGDKSHSLPAFRAMPFVQLALNYGIV